MTILTEGSRKADFMVSEANAYRSRDEGTVTVPANTTIPAGRVMGKITATGKFVPQVLAGTDDGTREGAAVLLAEVVNGTESAIDVTGTLVTRDAEVSDKHLTYDPAADADAIATVDAALAALDIIVR